MKKFRVLLLTFVVAVTMMAGSLAVFADETTPTPTTGGTPTDTTDGTVPISKTVKVADGITFSETITVTATQTDNADGITPPETGKTFTGTVDVTEAARTTPATGAIDFSTLTKPGEYTFIVKETAATTNSHGTWALDDQQYYLQVLVKANGDKQYAISEGNEFATSDDSEKKTDKAAFENTYTKKADLTVNKKVVNPEYVDPDTLYEFTVTFTAPSTETLAEDGYVISEATNAFTDEEGETAVVANTTKIKNNDKVYLKDGGSIKIKDLPAGVTYTVTEAAVTNVTTTVTLDGNASTNGASSVLDETGDVVAYTNTYKQITITGVIMNVLPFVMMIAIAGAAAAMYVASRRRKAARY